VFGEFNCKVIVHVNSTFPTESPVIRMRAVRPSASRTLAAIEKASQQLRR
jgi:hypothetical protein